MNKATVVAVGEGLKDKPIEVGMAVIHVKGAGTLIEHEKEEYFIMRFTDILCRVEEVEKTKPKWEISSNGLK